METVLVVSTPFLEELRERAAIATQNDEAQIEAMYLQKAADEIERQQAKIASLLKTVISKHWHGQLTPPAAKANGAKLYRSVIEVNHGGHEYRLEFPFAAKNDREALVYANRHAKKLFMDARCEDGHWSTDNGAVAWELMSVTEVKRISVNGTDGKLHVFDVARRLPEARHAS